MSDCVFCNIVNELIPSAKVLEDGMHLTWPAKNPPREQLEVNAAKIRMALE